MDILEKQKYVFGSLFLLANKLQVAGDQHLGRDGMTTKQWFLSAVITQFGENPPTLSEVSELMGSSRQNVKQLALKLEEKGFLRIDRDEEDARAFRLKLTEKSRKFWDERQQEDNRFIVELFKELSESEVDAIAGGLKKLLEKTEKMGKALSFSLEE